MGLSRLEHRLVSAQSSANYLQPRLTNVSTRVRGFPRRNSKVNTFVCVVRLGGETRNVNKRSPTMALLVNIDFDEIKGSPPINVRDQTKPGFHASANVINPSRRRTARQTPTLSPRANLDAIHFSRLESRGVYPLETSKKKEVWNCSSDYYWARTGSKARKWEKLGRFLMKLARRGGRTHPPLFPVSSRFQGISGCRVAKTTLSIV